mmetsp:Transcript_8438/g.27750  ORF Transcript_8438/g.27750 Transcript_8438/m.27750 type:complete len:240 (-) Transcript_8438:136-855(-)
MPLCCATIVNLTSATPRLPKAAPMRPAYDLRCAAHASSRRAAPQPKSAYEKRSISGENTTPPSWKPFGMYKTAGPQTLLTVAKNACSKEKPSSAGSTGSPTMTSGETPLGSDMASSSHDGERCCVGCASESTEATLAASSASSSASMPSSGKHQGALRSANVAWLVTWAVRSRGSRTSISPRLSMSLRPSAAPLQSCVSTFKSCAVLEESESIIVLGLGAGLYVWSLSVCTMLGCETRP